jgi:hypothetical protein
MAENSDAELSRCPSSPTEMFIFPYGYKNPSIEGEGFRDNVKGHLKGHLVISAVCLHG